MVSFLFLVTLIAPMDMVDTEKSITTNLYKYKKRKRYVEYGYQV